MNKVEDSTLAKIQLRRYEDRFDKTTEGYLAGKSNKALEKIAEEMTKDMAIDDPLSITTSKGFNGPLKTGARRAQYANLYDNLPDEQLTAANEICFAHMLSCGWLNYKTLNLLNTGNGQSNEDFTNKQIEILAKYKIWRESMIKKNKQKALDYTVSVFGQGMSIAQVVRRLHGSINEITVRRGIKTGLQEYVGIAA